MGKGSSGRALRQNSGGARPVNQSQGTQVNNNEDGFVINGTRYYATRAQAQQHAGPGEEVYMFASGSGYAFYYRPMRPEDYAKLFNRS